MDARDRSAAERMRARIERGAHERSLFRAALLGVSPTARDAWLDVALGLGELPDDGPELPRDCVPYLPCSVDTLLRVVEQTPVRASDVFVDIGSGVGRATALVHLLTGALAVGVEIQPALVRAAGDLAARLGLVRLTTIEGDAARLAGSVRARPGGASGSDLFSRGSVFFLYCPFSGDRLVRVLSAVEALAQTRTVHVCCVDLPLPPRPWLQVVPQPARDLTIHRSRLR